MLSCSSFRDHRNNWNYLGKLTEIYFVMRILMLINTCSFISSAAKVNEVHKTNIPTYYNSFEGRGTQIFFRIVA
jgi:hypothetical protein